MLNIQEHTQELEQIVVPEKLKRHVLKATTLIYKQNHKRNPFVLFKSIKDQVIFEMRNLVPIRNFEDCLLKCMNELCETGFLEKSKFGNSYRKTSLANNNTEFGWEPIDNDVDSLIVESKVGPKRPPVKTKLPPPVPQHNYALRNNNKNPASVGPETLRNPSTSESSDTENSPDSSTYLASCSSNGSISPPTPK